jgi:RNA polymerase sigma factor (sigma-70 family)
VSGADVWSLSAERRWRPAVDSGAESGDPRTAQDETCGRFGRGCKKTMQRTCSARRPGTGNDLHPQLSCLDQSGSGDERHLIVAMSTKRAASVLGRDLASYRLRRGPVVHVFHLPSRSHDASYGALYFCCTKPGQDNWRAGSISREDGRPLKIESTSGEPIGMANLLATSVVRQLGLLFEGGAVGGLSDRQLLDQFVAQRDDDAEAAFAALVARHGPMVLGICRQLLGDRQDADDAFQAVFFVLARRARSIKDPDLLGNWLYGVALRTARKARLRLNRRRASEADAAMRRAEADSRLSGSAEATAIAREHAQALHHEIARLPVQFRSSVVLCYFEGLSLDEAARRLSCPAGTVHSRLDRARARLRRGLTRRGIVFSGTALAGMLEAKAAWASISPSLADIATRGGMSFANRTAAAGILSASATTLAHDFL